MYVYMFTHNVRYYNFKQLLHLLNLINVCVCVLGFTKINI